MLDQYLIVWNGDDDAFGLADGESEIYGQFLAGVDGAPIGVNDFRISDMGPDGESGFDAEASFRYDRRYPPTINAPEQTERAAAAAATVVGEENVRRDLRPIMGAEDFAWMLKAKPGCYVWIGNGEGADGGCMVHNPNYDFNDEILPIGASYWSKLVEQELAAA